MDGKLRIAALARIWSVSMFIFRKFLALAGEEDFTD